jgi:hypothetical protein
MNEVDAMVEQIATSTIGRHRASFPSTVSTIKRSPPAQVQYQPFMNRTKAVTHSAAPITVTMGVMRPALPIGSGEG